MTPDEVVTRVHSAIGKKTIYALGSGGMNPLADHPANGKNECDCSGCANWGLNRSRLDGTGKWWGTDQIYDDAIGRQTRFKKVDPISAQPGDVMVYPHSEKEEYGHIGIVTAISSAGPTLVVHCSHGNYKLTGDAIQETAPTVFLAGGAIVARQNDIVIPA